ncbi:MAG: hypothetical protein AAGC65_04455 [Mucilaginibacter sp.]|uniref:hypothetical protein n=1 Tax=Mucilaginibacter sp. TaxID=1882438 RepID=UPI0031B34B22
MIHTEFVTKLKGIASSPEFYKAHGLDQDLINEIIEGYQISKTSNSQPLINDELLLLLENYDLTKTAIGMVEFVDKPYRNDNRIFFGKFEVDDLVIDIPTGEVRCFESKSTHLLWACAKSGGHFLSSLYEAASFLEKRMLDNELYENEDIGQDVARYCAELAGGNQYVDFYMTLFS